MNTQAASTSHAIEINLRDYVHILYQSRWKIAWVVFVGGMIGVALAFLQAPVYQANVLLHIEKKQNSLGGLNDLNALLSGESPVDTELGIIKSRVILREVIRKLQLDIVAKPFFFPFINTFAKVDRVSAKF